MVSFSISSIRSRVTVDKSSIILMINALSEAHLENSLKLELAVQPVLTKCSLAHIRPRRCKSGLYLWLRPILLASSRAAFGARAGQHQNDSQRNVGYSRPIELPAAWASDRQVP